ncbi:MAG: hypothetical protein AAGN64_01790 [Bacteroidota bacterium]
MQTHRYTGKTRYTFGPEGNRVTVTPGCSITDAQLALVPDERQKDFTLNVPKESKASETKAKPKTGK